MTPTRLAPAASVTPDTIKEDIQTLLQMAERGELRDMVVVAAIVDEDGPGYLRMASFDDRWRLLGALAHAQAAVGR